MKTIQPSKTLAQPFWPVKLINSQLPLPFSDSMIHHKLPLSIVKPIIVSYKNFNSKPYGVSRSRRAITSSLFIKKFDYIRNALRDVLGLTRAQRDVTLELLRLWAYYGLVYPKEAHITEDSYTSKATYWRTVKILKALKLLSVVNRYVIRPHAQISNLYRLDRLALLLARYLAEHGVAFWEKWLRPALTMPGRQFWSQVWGTRAIRAAPVALAYSGP